MKCNECPSAWAERDIMTECGVEHGDYGCTCPHSDKWYACPIENKKPENIQALKEYAEWLPQYEGKWMAESEGK